MPVICFGHSMGGLIALNHALDNSGRLAGLACWNANFSAGIPGWVGRSLLAWERFRLGYDVPSRLAPALTFRAWAKAMPDRVTDFDWISRDREEVAKYVADPLCGRDASVSIWRDVFGLIFRGQVNAVMSAVGYNFRLILKWLRNFLCLIASGIIEALMPVRTTKAAAW